MIDEKLETEIKRVIGIEKEELKTLQREKTKIENKINRVRTNIKAKEKAYSLLLGKGVVVKKKENTNQSPPQPTEN